MQNKTAGLDYLYSVNSYAPYLLSLKSRWITEFFQIYLYFSVNWNVDKKSNAEKIKYVFLYGIHSLNTKSGYHCREQILILLLTNIFVSSTYA